MRPGPEHRDHHMQVSRESGGDRDRGEGADGDIDRLAAIKLQAAAAPGVGEIGACVPSWIGDEENRRDRPRGPSDGEGGGEPDDSDRGADEIIGL